MSSHNVYKTITIFMLVSSMLSFIVSLFLPAYWVDSPSATFHYGISALIFGPFLLLTGHLFWLANPFLCASWVFLIERRHIFLALISSLIALAFALPFSYGELIPVYTWGGKPNGHYKVGTGYQAWIFSIALAILSSLINAYHAIKIKRQKT